MSDVLLAIEGLDAFYGDAQALRGISLSLRQGEVLALIGANGAGKSTLLRAICGLARDKRGRIAFKGDDIAALPAYEIVARGIALAPEGRRLFASLSVEENLLLGGQVARPGPWSLASLYRLFPVLQEKRHAPAASLSGGQQQMAAIGRALMSNPELILLDELSLGLAPAIIKDIYALLPEITAGGLSVMLVEQDVSRALNAATQFICMLEGAVALAGAPGAYSRQRITAAYFGG